MNFGPLYGAAFFARRRRRREIMNTLKNPTKNGAFTVVVFPSARRYAVASVTSYDRTTTVRGLTKELKQRYIRNKALSEYLGVTTMTLYRWQKNPALGFPQPARVNGISFTNIDEVDAWLKARVVNRNAPKAE